MIAIGLYMTYLNNAVLGMSRLDKLKKLDYEKEKISEIIDGLDCLFENDLSVTDKDNHSIYAVIKKDMLNEIFTQSNTEASVTLCKAQLMEIIDTIDARVRAISA